MAYPGLGGANPDYSQGAYTCPFCGAISQHPRDIRETYCGRCHVFACDVLQELQAGLLTHGSHIAVSQPTAARSFDILFRRTADPAVVYMPREIAERAEAALKKVINR